MLFSRYPHTSSSSASPVAGTVPSTTPDRAPHWGGQPPLYGGGPHPPPPPPPIHSSNRAPAGRMARYGVVGVTFFVFLAMVSLTIALDGTTHARLAAVDDRGKAEDLVFEERDGSGIFVGAGGSDEDRATSRLSSDSRQQIKGVDASDLLWKDVGLGLKDDSPGAEEAFLVGKKERERLSAQQNERSSLDALLSSSVPPAPQGYQGPNAHCAAGRGGAGCPLRIDLVMYVLFQRQINGKMVSGINWDWIPRLDQDLPPPTDETLKKHQTREEFETEQTQRVVRHMRSESWERDRTRLAFVAVNPHIEKAYRLLPAQIPEFLRVELSSTNKGGGPTNESHFMSHAMRHGNNASKLVNVPPHLIERTFLAGRLLQEWTMPGYSADLSKRGVGSQRGQAKNEDQNGILHHLEEFGTMRTLYYSGLTFLHTSNALVGPEEPLVANDTTRTRVETNTSSSVTTIPQRRPLAADADGDGVQEWMGIFPSDMRIDLRLLQLIRRRIRQGTSRYLGKNVTFERFPGTTIGAPQLVSGNRNSNNPTTGKKRKGGAFFKGRVVGGAVVNDQLVNRAFELKALGPPRLPDAFSPDIKLPANHHCCIFFSGSYPAIYLFNNLLGQELLALYNAFFHKNVSFAHLIRPNGPDAILEAFVLPNALFNKVFPFVDHIIRMLVVDGAVFPNPEVPARSNGGGEARETPHAYTLNISSSNNSSWAASPTDVLERALSLALVLEPKWMRIRLPVRHARDF